MKISYRWCRKTKVNKRKRIELDEKDDKRRGPFATAVHGAKAMESSLNFYLHPTWGGGGGSNVHFTLPYSPSKLVSRQIDDINSFAPCLQLFLQGILWHADCCWRRAHSLSDDSTIKTLNLLSDCLLHWEDICIVKSDVWNYTEKEAANCRGVRFMYLKVLSSEMDPAEIRLIW